MWQESIFEDKSSDYYIKSELERSCKHGDFSSFIRLSNHYLDLVRNELRDIRYLYIACSYNSYLIANKILELDIEFKSSRLDPLAISCHNQNLEIVKLLIDYNNCGKFKIDKSKNEYIRISLAVTNIQSDFKCKWSPLLFFYLVQNGFNLILNSGIDFEFIFYNHIDIYNKWNNKNRDDKEIIKILFQNGNDSKYIAELWINTYMHLNDWESIFYTLEFEDCGRRFDYIYSEKFKMKKDELISYINKDLNSFISNRNLREIVYRYILIYQNQ